MHILHSPIHIFDKSLEYQQNELIRDFKVHWFNNIPGPSDIKV